MMLIYPVLHAWKKQTWNLPFKIFFEFKKPLLANDYPGSWGAPWQCIQVNCACFSSCSCYCQKVGATGHLWPLGHHLFTYMHTAQAASLQRLLMSKAQGAGQAKGAKALLKASFRASLGASQTRKKSCHIEGRGSQPVQAIDTADNCCYG